MPRHVVSNLLGLAGAVVGGTLGFLATGFLAERGFYAILLPGGLLGLGCGLLARHRSTARGIACGLAGLLLGLLAEWSNFPFVRDNRLSFFVTHLQWVPAWRWSLLGLGTLLAFWCGRDTFGIMPDRPSPGKPVTRPSEPAEAGQEPPGS